MRKWVLLGIAASSFSSLGMVSHDVDARTRRKAKTASTQSANSSRTAMAKFVALLQTDSDADLMPFISKNGLSVVSDGQRSKISYSETKAEGLHGIFAPGAVGMNDIFRRCKWRFKAISPNTFAADASKTPDAKEMADPKRIYVKWKREGRTWKIAEYAFPMALTG